MQPTDVDAAGETIAAGQSVGADLPIAQGGQLLANRYEILRLIGTGGMGRVYRVRDRELDEIVALKMLRRDLLGSDEMLDRFRQEVKLARRVTHHNVARMFDIGEHGGERFLTMELIEGEALADTLVRRGSLPVGEALALAADICSGMAAAHAAGVIHRDLKPENVLVTPDARAVVTDFGIALTDGSGAAGGALGGIAGTPAYMAPEQLHSAAVDARADVYAFGAVLYEMLTGARAWPGDAPMAVASARLVEDPPDPRRVRTGISDVVAMIVLKCLARDPNARFQSATALAEALHHATLGRVSLPAPGIPVPAPNESVATRTKSVAVLAFRNSGPSEDAYLAEGLTDDLTDLLSMTQRLRVRARGAIEDRDAAMDIASIGRSMGVDVVIDGSVRRAGEQLRVSVRMVSVDDGFQIWAARFDRPVSAALMLNDEVARAAATALSTENNVPARTAATDPKAIELYLRARYEARKFWQNGGDRGLQLFREALELAPENPTIISGYVGALALTFLQKIPYETMEPLVTKAIRSAPYLGEPWVALARVRFNARNDAPGAARALRRAIANAPSLADAQDMAGRLLLEAGDFAQAIPRLEHALWLDPLLSHARMDLMRAAALESRWDRVEELRAARTDEGWLVPAAMTLKRIALWRRLPSEQQLGLEMPPGTAIREIALHEVFNRVSRDGVLTDADRAALASFLDSVPPNSRARRLFTQFAAEFHLFVGENEKGLEMIRTAVDHGLIDLSWMDRNPLLAPIRGTDAFLAARVIVVARAQAILEARAGPPEPLPT